MYTYTLSMIQHHTVLRSGLPYTTVGEVRNLPPPARELRGREGRDSYVVVALDSEEIFRTVTAEKTLRWVCVCAHVQKRKVLCYLPGLFCQSVSTAYDTHTCSSVLRTLYVYVHITERCL